MDDAAGGNRVGKIRVTNKRENVNPNSEPLSQSVNDLRPSFEEFFRSARLPAVKGESLPASLRRTKFPSRRRFAQNPCVSFTRVKEGNLDYRPVCTLCATFERLTRWDYH
jgi:hypothetical protein